MTLHYWPFQSVDADRPITEDLLRATFAGMFSTGVLVPFAATNSAAKVLSFNAGAAIIDGVLLAIDGPVSLDLTARAEASLYICARLDETARTVTIVATVTPLATGTTTDLVIGTATFTGPANYVFSGAAVTRSHPGGVIDADHLAAGAVTAEKLDDTGWLTAGIVRYRRVGPMVFCDWYRSATIAAGATATIGTLPVGYRPSVTTPVAIKGDLTKILHGTIGANGAIEVTNTSASAAVHFGAANFLI